MEREGEIGKENCEICVEPLESRPQFGRCAHCRDRMHRYCALKHRCEVGSYQPEHDGRSWLTLALAPLALLLLFGYEMVAPAGLPPETLSLGKRRVHQSDYQGYSLALKRRAERRGEAPRFVMGSALAILGLVGFGLSQMRQTRRQWHLGPARGGEDWRPGRTEARRLLYAAVIGAAGEPSAELQRFVVGHEAELKSGLVAGKGNRFSLYWWPELSPKEVAIISEVLELEPMIEPLTSLALLQDAGRSARVAELRRLAAGMPKEIRSQILARLDREGPRS